MRTWLLLTLLAPPSALQDPPDRYRDFLKEHEGLTLEEFHRRYSGSPAYVDDLEVDLGKVRHLDLVQTRVKPAAGRQSLTDSELEALRRRGFVVVERWAQPSFGHAYYDVYRNDQPLLITTDSILHAFHKSFDKALEEMEEGHLAPLLEKILAGALYGLRNIERGFDGNPPVLEAARDVRFLLETGRAILSGREAGSPRVRAALEAMRSVQPLEIEFLGRPRRVDFSQFTPRGHYTKSDRLDRYFRAMVWLGREDLSFRFAESFREALAAMVLVEALERSRANADWERLNRAVTLLVGSCDGATPADIARMAAASGFKDLRDFAIRHDPSEVMGRIAAQPGGEQEIMSGIFAPKRPGDPPFRLPRTAQFLGQRFTLDSFIFNNVTYDHIPGGVIRLMPSPLDLMAALGSPRALEHLEPELRRFGYQASLAASIDTARSLPESFWQRTVYHGWLDVLRPLSGDTTGEPYPPVMRTRAWADLKLQTQLASWSQLRRDTVLYVKQSYSDVTCSYPEVCVEPYPEFYDRVRGLCERLGALFTREEEWAGTFRERARGLGRHFARFAETAAMLSRIAGKELKGREPDRKEREFLKGILSEGGRLCGDDVPFNGWYRNLFLGDEDCLEWKPTVADVHIQPTDESGNTVGRILHAATGNVDLAVVVIGDGAFLAPVFSYYEFSTEDFRRLTDEEWGLQVGRPAEWILRGSGPHPGTGPPPPRPFWTRDLRGN